MFGQQLRLLSLACGRGPAFIAAALPDGRRRLVRRAATDLERPLTPPATLPRISARTLLPLARHVRSMLAFSTKEVRHANPPLPSLSASSKATVSLSASAAPWTALPESARMQLAQQIARLLRRAWDAEARHADHSE